MGKSAIQRARDSATRLRAKAKERQGFAVRKVAMGASAWTVGKVDAGVDVLGMNIQIPNILGMPKSGTLALLGYGVALMSAPDGLAANIGEGMGDAGLAIALFQTGAGETVAGHEDVSGDEDMEEVDQLVDELHELSAAQAVEQSSGVEQYAPGQSPDDEPT